jgi:hypothetical protein
LLNIPDENMQQLTRVKAHDAAAAQKRRAATMDFNPRRGESRELRNCFATFLLPFVTSCAQQFSYIVCLTRIETSNLKIT